uniref:Uncharacterized protein n=1 Tax=Anopheles merus TaxID=30066 RepID=A0A182UN41_ANOME
MKNSIAHRRPNYAPNIINSQPSKPTQPTHIDAYLRSCFVIENCTNTPERQRGNETNTKKVAQVVHSFKNVIYTLIRTAVTFGVRFVALLLLFWLPSAGRFAAVS